MKEYTYPLWELLEQHPIPDEYLLMDVSDDVVSVLEAEAVGFDSVPAILDVMETYPLVDFGTPGSLTHFLEKYYISHKEVYEATLLASVGRSPSVHTLWLLNRVANVQDGAAREPYLLAFRQTATNKAYPLEVRQQAQNFLDVQLDKER